MKINNIFKPFTMIGSLNPIYRINYYYLKILKKFFQLKSLVVEPKKSSSLYLMGIDGLSCPLYLPLDKGIGVITFVQKSYDIHKVNAISAYLSEFYKSDSNLSLIDIGANIGLFTRQCNNKFGKYINSYFAYEPEVLNFQYLEKNLSRISNCNINNYGLGRDTSKHRIYKDINNCGNYSLHLEAMPSSYTYDEISIKTVRDEVAIWEKVSNFFIYKSDTQGYDEIIACELGENFFQNVVYGIIEIWNLKSKSYDLDEFTKILNLFPNKFFQSRPNINLSTSDVIKITSASNWVYDDLIFWK
jgi:FkbM family methyltransferase